MRCRREQIGEQSRAGPDLPRRGEWIAGGAEGGDAAGESGGRGGDAGQQVAGWGRGVAGRH